MIESCKGNEEDKQTIINIFAKLYANGIEVTIKQLKELYAKFKETYAKLGKYFCYKENDNETIPSIFYTFRSFGNEWYQYLNYLERRDYIEAEEKRRLEKKQKLAESIKKRKEKKNLFRYNRIIAEDIKVIFSVYPTKYNEFIVRENPESAVKGQFNDAQKAVMKNLFEKFVDVE